MKIIYQLIIANYAIVLAQDKYCLESCYSEGICSQLVPFLKGDKCFPKQNYTIVDCHEKQYLLEKDVKVTVKGEGNFLIYYKFTENHPKYPTFYIKKENQNACMYQYLHEYVQHNNLTILIRLLFYRTGRGFQNI